MKNFGDILAIAKRRGSRRLAVACAADEAVLLAVDSARKEGVATAILVGDRPKMEEIAKECGIDLSNYEVIDEPDLAAASLEAVKLVSSGKADILMKGLVDTSIILKAVLNKEVGLRTGKPLSHVVAFKADAFDRVLFVTDAAMTLAPDLEGKKHIIENAVSVAHALGIEEPKVAVLCAKEKVDEKMSCTLDAHELEEMNKKGEISGCLVGGPFALDNAVSEEAAEHKGIHHPVAGKADILLVPDLEAGNILYKSITFIATAMSAGLIVGASAPIVLTSRADSHSAKFNSIVLGVMTSK
ncbi:MAG: phosphate butyryltransferase [Peptostreptococcaceae bacterium]|nr:phosphate butyryltransferase [Peptostreptococcaceae bacterium]